MDNSQKRHVIRTMTAICLMKKNVTEHRNTYEEEKERCKKENEDYIVDKYIVGRLTYIKNELSKVIDIFCYKFKDIDFMAENEKNINIVINRIYDEIAVENARSSGCQTLDINEEKKSPYLPKNFVDYWVAAWFSYRYLKNNFQKTLDRYGVDFKKIDNAMNKYEDYFIKDIMAIR